MTVRLRVAVVVAGAFALAVGLARAGQQTGSPPPQAQPAFKAGTTIVEVDAIVTGKDGTFVTGLTADDFEVLEDGKPQKIERIYIVTGSTVSAAPGEVPASVAGVEAAAARPPAAPGAPQRVFVLLFDQEHLQVGAFKRLQEAAVTFLSNEFRQGDIGGVVIGSTMAGNQLTTNRESLLAAVQHAKPSAAKTSRRVELFEWPRFNSEAEAVRIALVNDTEVLDQAVRRACQDDPVMCTRADVGPVIMEKARRIVGELRPAARRTIMTLQALASGLARLPGRKTIMLMTEGFFVEESWADLRQIVGAAARSNVRIYSLDARGLDTRQVNDLSQLSVMDPGGSMPLEAYNTIEDGPNMLAVDTGGYPIRHTNKFADAMAEIARDTSNYYVIGYSPANAVMDGSFRTITVRVRRDGVRVRARRGYLATPASATLSSPGSQTTNESPPSPGAAPPPPAGAPSPSPPATAPTSPAAAPTAAPEGAAPSPAAASPVWLRPDVSRRVRELAERTPEAGPPKSLASEGWERYGKGDLEGAEALLERAAAPPDAAPWVSYVLGFAKLGLKKPREAAVSWERVRAAVPEFQAVYLDLADAYLQLDDAGRAAEILRAAETRWPADPEVLNALGTVQVRRGSLNDAIDTFQRAIAARSSDALAYLNLARTYELRYYKMRRYSRPEARWVDNPDDLKKAIEHYERYIALGGPYEADARQAVERLRWVK